MEKVCKIMRRSIYSFFQRYQYYTLVAAILALPFSLSVLLSQALINSSSSSLPILYSRLQILFDAAGFPSSELFNFLKLKLSQTISSSMFTLPFTLTFLLFAKASVIQALRRDKTSNPSSFSYFISIYNSMFNTYVCSSLLILSANATAFALLFISFNCLEGFGFTSSNSLYILSALGAVLYSIILANVLVICNLALVLSGMERRGGFLTILKACVLMRGRTSLALSLALPANLAMAACEVLFQYRVVGGYKFDSRSSTSIALEGIFIAYLYSILLVVETVVSCFFFKSCKMDYVNDEQSFSSRLEISEEDDGNCRRLKIAEEALPMV